MNPVYTYCFKSPLGPICLAGRGDGLQRIAFARGIPAPNFPSEWLTLPARGVAPTAAQVLLAAARQIEEYFAGKRRVFELPLAAMGNAFQMQVWNTLVKIPYGETWTYGQLADRIGRPGSARAVGSANARNPLPIVVPCHRVIGADGKLTGYYGGLHLKAFLLELEGASVATAQASLL